VAQETDLLHELIEEEGPQIMTWLIEGAYKALTMGRAKFLELAQPLLDAAEEAVSEGDPRQQWIDDRGIERGDPDKDYILLQTAFHDYLGFRQTEERGYTERRSSFKNAMKEIFGWKWEPVRRGEPDKNKHGVVAAYGWKWRGTPVTEE
jgi:phage/plasmid-associated DNA primase